MTRWARLRRDLAAPQANRARTVDSKSALSKGDHAAPVTFGADLERSARRSAAAVAGAALLTDLEIDRNLSAARRGAEWDVEIRLDGLSLLRPARPRSLPRFAATEHRAEEIAQPAEPADVKVLKIDRLAAGRPTRAGSARRSAAAETTEPRTVKRT